MKKENGADSGANVVNNLLPRRSLPDFHTTRGLSCSTWHIAGTLTRMEASHLLLQIEERRPRALRGSATDR
jgi:hypothetical protein